VGALLGDPGVTVGPAVVGTPEVGLTVLGAAVVGAALEKPGLTVGPAVVGAPVVGLAVVGALLGDPGVTVGPAVVGVAAGLAVAAQSKKVVITRSPHQHFGLQWVHWSRL
jgi:hypothetical protein